MPLIVALGLALLVLLASIALLPLTLIQRYRVGTVRRAARSWIITLNVAGLALSTVIFFTGAAVTTIWVPETFVYSVAGFATGCMLGLAGLAMTRWEPARRSLHYTPNRWLVLGITLVVTARLLYGFWRGWHTWRTAEGATSWLAASGAAGSMAAGAVVLGYYLVYWAGVRRKLNRQLR